MKIYGLPVNDDDYVILAHLKAVRKVRYIIILTVYSTPADFYRGIYAESTTFRNSLTDWKRQTSFLGPRGGVRMFLIPAGSTSGFYFVEPLA